jgi:hypothetical protein
MRQEPSSLSYTVEHFKEVARQNRFAENNRVEHDEERCLICHPESFPDNPFAIYLKVVAESVKVRRPSLDQTFVDEINSDLELMGEPGTVTRESLLEGDPAALQYWSAWVREALSTGLGLLSIHSGSSHEFTLEDAEEQGLKRDIDAAVEDIMDFQKETAKEAVREYRV